MSSFTKTGTSNAQSDGGNVFNSATTISNTGASGRIRMATVSGDTYNADATFNSTGQDVQIAYSGDNTFAGNITINSNKVVFNTSTGKVTFTGTNNQTLNGSYNYPFKKMAINKTAGTVTANTTLSVDDSLIFIQGNLITTSTNLLTMKNGSTATGGSNSSFVSGPVKKVGNAAFEYPIGKEDSFLPLTISAPATTSSEFVAEYKIDSIGVHTGVKDSTLGYVFRDCYWTLNRTSGSSSVYVTLSWDGYYRLLDSIATTCYWDGSKWANLGQGTYSSTDSTGTMRTSNAINNFSEFTFAYKSIGTISGLPFSCSNIQTQGQLQVCLNAGAPICQITTNIDLIDNGPTGKLYLPINIPEGSVLQGYNSTNINQAWWQEGCRVLSTTKTTLYKTPLKNMFMFTLEPGAAIQNLRLRGASCNFQDYNGDQKLCGGIYIGEDFGTGLTTTIENCEVGCFSYAGIFKSTRPRSVLVKNCYVQKVKANGNGPGLGYGCWAQGLFLDPNDDGNITYENVIFDDCKAAIDGQGYPNNWNINKCSFTQFFLSEDINMHNIKYYVNHPLLLNFSCFTLPPASICSGNIFYGPFCNTSNVCSTQLICSGYPEDPPPNNWQTAGQDIHIYDNGGANTNIENSIFHNYILKDKNGANISLNYPLRNHPLGNTSYLISILNNTFSTPFYDPKDIFTYNNNGGYARVADNYIEACVWGTTFSRSGNTFSYKPGVTATSTQPCEVNLDLIETISTNPLPITLNNSVTPNKNFTQWIDLSTDFRLTTTPGTLGSQTQHYIIRPNPNKDIPAPFNGVVSNGNYYYDGEIRTDQNSITIPGYTKPGLYGIDVLAFDVQSTSEYNSSAWQHIPLIVKPDDNDNLKLYFNIKDSFKEFLGVSSTGVFKQVELNGYPIWREDIAEGGDGWENVVVDLTGDVLTPASGTIISKLNLDGTKNTITFSINVSSGTLSTGTIRGAIVWVDDIYIKKHSHPFGENLILDGSIENSSNADFKNAPSQQCSWYNPKVFTFANCSTLRVSSGANGEIDQDETMRYVDESPFKQISQVSITSDANISNTERKSGNNSLSLILPAAIYEPGCANYPITAGENVVEVSTDIDVTELFDCRSFWDASTSSSALGFEEFPGFSAIQPNKSYYVGSDLEVNSGETWTIEGCQMVFAPGIQVVIHDGGRLNIQTTIDEAKIIRTNLFSCDEMWQGIIVEDGGSLTINGQITGITGRFCTIQNAIKAVHLPGDPSGSTSDVIIRNTNFTDNLVSIYAKDCQIPGTSQISGNNFGVTNAIITKEPCMGVYPENHIYLNNVLDATIGVGSSINMSNYFTGVKIGINAINSDLKVQNSEFDNLVDYAVSPSQKGIGINAQNGTITPRIIEVDSRFRNLHRGIFTRGNFDVTIQGCDHFRDIDETAISINSMNYQNTITITDNPQFQRTNIGIRVTGGKLSSVTISNNKLNNTDFIETNSGSFHNTGITVQKWSSSLFADNVTIFDNEITNCRIGIHANNVKNLTIGKVLQNPTTLLGNIITSNYQTGFAPAEIYRGIWVQNSNNAFIVGNEVVNIYEITGSTTNFRGIEIQNCYDGRLNCNTIDNIPLSFYIFGRCDGTLLRKNTMSHYDAGIELESATIAPQFQINNSTGDEEPIDNVWTDDPAPFGDATDRVTGTTNSGQVLWLYQTSNGDYNPLDGGTTSPVVNAVDDGAGIVACDDVSNRQSRETRFAATVGDSLVFDAFEVEQTWMARKYAYESMRSDSTLLYQDTLTDQIYQDFFWREDSLNTGKFGTIRLLSADTSYFGTAEAINEAVFDEIDLETNLKLANSYFFNNLAIDEPFNSADSSAVLALAELPYYAAGEAAFIAFGMLGLERTPYIPVLRIAPEIIIPIQNSNPPQNSIQLFPVPVNNYIHVGSSILTIDKVEIFDSQLKLVDQKVIHSREFEMSTGFNPGVYGMKFYLADGTIQWKKLVKL
jgi:hypothetical protein